MNPLHPRPKRHTADNRLESELNRLLDGQSLESPSPAFTNRLLARLENSTDELSSAASRGAEEPSESRVRKTVWHRSVSAELTNGLVATAATYLIIATGVFGRVIDMSTGDWSHRLTRTVSDTVLLGQGAVLEWSQRFAEWLITT